MLYLNDVGDGRRCPHLLRLKSFSYIIEEIELLFTQENRDEIVSVSLKQRVKIVERPFGFCG